MTKELARRASTLADERGIETPDVEGVLEALELWLGERAEPDGSIAPF